MKSSSRKIDPQLKRVLKTVSHLEVESPLLIPMFGLSLLQSVSVHFFP